MCLAASLVSQGNGQLRSGGRILMRNARVLFAGLMILALVPGLARGQGSSTATVTGTVADQKGAADTGPASGLLHTPTNESRPPNTSDTRDFTYVRLHPLLYKDANTTNGLRKPSHVP